MTSTTTEPQPYPWLPLARVLSWLRLDDDADGTVEDVRRAAADAVEDARPDLSVGTDTDGDGVLDSWTYTPTERVVQGAVLLASRLYARKGSPAGLASYGEFGAVEVLRYDPDVARLLGVGRYAKPAVG